MPPQYQPLNVADAQQASRVDAPQTPIGSGRGLSTYRASGSINPWYCSFPACNGCWRWMNERFPMKKFVGYISGGLFAVGWWIFIDCVVYAKTRDPPLPVPIQFEDWLPGILSTLALIMVNLVDKAALNATEYTHDGTRVAVKARFFAFLGVAIALGSLGGALAILSLKYALPGYKGVETFVGVGIVLQSFLIFAGSMIMWFGRNSSEPELDLAW